MVLSIQENVPLAPLTTFKIGGSAKYLTTVRIDGEIEEALAWAREHRVPFTILAGGSNVLIPDDGLRALVIRIESNLISFNGRELAADAGCNLLALIRSATSKGLGGWEKLSGIPGTIGGAVRGNAGAFGSEIKDIVIKVKALDTESGETREFTNSSCQFSYRQSFFKKNPKWIILRAHIKLNLVEPNESEKLIYETIDERERRHLQNVQAAGSFFMNPIASKKVQELFEREKGQSARGDRVPAGWLIEKVGLKGATEGGAIASLQHPNYIVNTGSATATDVRQLAERIKKAIMDEYGILLEEEAAELC